MMIKTTLMLIAIIALAIAIGPQQLGRVAEGDDN